MVSLLGSLFGAMRGNEPPEKEFYFLPAVSSPCATSMQFTPIGASEIKRQTPKPK
jgi:hypothetical protein